MATHRYLQCAFWTDPFILGLTPEEKYFYIYLMTNPHTRQCGVYELPSQLMQLETGYNLDTLIKLVNRFIDYKKIEYSDQTDEVFIVNWLKFNSPNSIPVIKCIQRELSTIKTIDFKRKVIELMHKKGYALDTPSIPHVDTTIKELKELNLKELNASGAKTSDPVEWEKQKEKLTSKPFNSFPTQPQKRKTKINSEQWQAEVDSITADIAQNKTIGKNGLVSDLQQKLDALLATPP